MMSISFISRDSILETLQRAFPVSLGHSWSVESVTAFPAWPIWLHSAQGILHGNLLSVPGWIRKR